jgi:hypothetical protein
MRFLRQNTAIRITVGPFLDKTDGITPETGLTATNEHLTLMVDDGNVPTLVLDANATASAGNNDMVHVTNDDAGFYDLELTAAQTNYLGRAMLSINYVTDHCPVFHEFMILPAMVYDSMILGTDVMDASMTQILGTAVSAPATAGILDINLKNIANAAVSTTTAQLGVNAVQISGDATAADNCESDYDGTGYAGGTIVKQADVTKWVGQAALAVVNGSPVCTLGATQAAYAPAKAGDAMLITAGSGAGQLDVTSGVIKANLAQILGTALTETGGYLAAAFKKFFNVATPVATAESVNQTGDAYAKVDTEIGTLQTDVTAIRAKTDMQPTVWYSA